MPLSPDPGEPIAFTFATVDGRTLPYVARFLTRRERMAWRRIVDRIGGQAIGSPELDALLDQALAVGTDYTVAGLAGTLTDRDILQLARSYPNATLLSVEDVSKVRIAGAYVYRHKGLCEKCVGGACHDEPTERRWLNIACPTCDGDLPAVETCPRCTGRGSIKLTQCPRAYVDPVIWDAVNLCGFVDKGAWPVAGGTLDQSDSFLAFRTEWIATLERMKAPTP